jgi:hypothetical protein
MKRIGIATAYKPPFSHCRKKESTTDWSALTWSYFRRQTNKRAFLYPKLIMLTVFAGHFESPKKTNHERDIHTIVIVCKHKPPWMAGPQLKWAKLLVEENKGVQYFNRSLQVMRCNRVQGLYRRWMIVFMEWNKKEKRYLIGHNPQVSLCNEGMGERS